jgi:hypothetical protein
MKLPALARITLVALLLAGCSLRPGGQATPSSRPVVTPAPIPSASAPPPATTSPEPTRPAEPSATAPPRGLLAAGSTTVVGWAGSYCWQNGCVDMAGIPPKAELPEITATDGRLVFSLSDGATFSGWTVSYGIDADTGSELTILDQGGTSADPDAQPQSAPPELGSVEFGPPKGDWVLLLSVQFPGGDLSYAWHVLVE